MIKTENVTINGLNLVHTFSDIIKFMGSDDEAVVIGHSYTLRRNQPDKRDITPATEPEMREALTILGVDIF